MFWHSKSAILFLKSINKCKSWQVSIKNSRRVIRNVIIAWLIFTRERVIEKRVIQLLITAFSRIRQGHEKKQTSIPTTPKLPNLESTHSNFHSDLEWSSNECAVADPTPATRESHEPHCWISQKCEKWNLEERLLKLLLSMKQGQFWEFLWELWSLDRAHYGLGSLKKLPVNFSVFK